jgi:hypothetical protein
VACCHQSRYDAGTHGTEPNESDTHSSSSVCRGQVVAAFTVLLPSRSGRSAS